MMNHHIQYLKGVELPPPLCYQLRPLISAYRPHDQPPTQKDLDSIDYLPRESHCSMENIKDTVKGIQGQNLAWLEARRKYNSKWKGYRSYYNLFL